MPSTSVRTSSKVGRNFSDGQCQRAPLLWSRGCQKSTGKAPFGWSKYNLPGRRKTRRHSAMNRRRSAVWFARGRTQYSGFHPSSTPMCSRTPLLITRSNDSSLNGSRIPSATHNPERGKRGRSSHCWTRVRHMSIPYAWKPARARCSTEIPFPQPQSSARSSRGCVPVSRQNC